MTPSSLNLSYSSNLEPIDQSISEEEIKAMFDSRKQVPVIFNNQQGILSPVIGTGYYQWDLSVNKYHKGSLIWTVAKGWVFHDQKGELGDLGECFGTAVVAHHRFKD